MDVHESDAFCVASVQSAGNGYVVGVCISGSSAQLLCHKEVLIKFISHPCSQVRPILTINFEAPIKF